MLSFLQQRRKKMGYLLRSSRGWFRGTRWNCPNCGHCRSQLVKRKFLVTALVRCEKCEVLFRAPTDTPDYAADFYQDDYQSGFTTYCPSIEELTALKASRFCGTPKDFSEKIKLLDALFVTDGSRILDFGASWGYGCWQLMQAGWDVVGYELSRPRARYAREQMGATVFDDLQQITGRSFDVFFSSHVLEHVAGVDDVLCVARQFLRPGGLFVAFTPNVPAIESRVRRQRVQTQWSAGVDSKYAWVHDSGSPAPGRTQRVRRLAEALDRRADVRMDRTLPQTQQRLRTNNGVERSADPNQHDPPDASPS